MTTRLTELTVQAGDSVVSAVLTAPAECKAAYLLAHGAGAGMRHLFLANMAELLAGVGIATLRYNFPYMELGKGRVDAPNICHVTVRAAAAELMRQLPGVPLIAGGKSFGGRMTSQAQALEPLVGVSSLAFLGFPLHPPGKPSVDRADHLANVKVPMLFLQGSRDEFAQLALLHGVVARLGERARLFLVEGGDHSFGVRKSAGLTAGQVRAILCGQIAGLVPE